MSQMLELELRRKSVTADALGRYYTSSQVSSALINAMSGEQPNLVLDLGSGHGSLSNAAYEKWGNAHYVTVDADNTARLSFNGSTSSASHIHHLIDALDENLSDEIGIPLDSVDMGLCNPPYLRPRWRSGFGRILEDAGLTGALQSVYDAGADLLFMAQNLRLLKSQGKLGLILPDGLITGEKYQGVRGVLLRDHRVDQVIQLPRGVFSKTEAQTYLLVLSKRCGETQSVALSKMDDTGEVSAPLCILPELAKLRLDYTFHALRASTITPGDKQQSLQTVGSLVSEMFRGTISSNQISKCPLPVFHLGDFPVNNSSTAMARVPPNFIQPHHDESSGPHGRYKMAREGDILMARIGRNLQEKVCLLDSGSCVISDCIFVLRVEPKHRGALLSYLVSEKGKSFLAAASHGVGARYLSRADVLSIAVLS